MPKTSSPGGGGELDSAAVVAAYCAELRAASQSPATVNLRGYQLRAWLRACPDWAAATRDDVVAYLDDAGASPETLASKRAALTAFYDWLIATGQRSEANPVTGMKRIHRNAGVPRPCPDAVVATALAEADAPTRRMILLGRFAGLRAAEIAACRTDDLTPDSRGLRVLGKGRKLRIVPAHPQVVAVLAEVPPGWVFPRTTSRGGPHWAGNAVSHKVSSVLPAPWTCHTLRHRFATDLYAACHDLRIVQAALGHASLATTARYLAIDDDAAFQAVAGLRLAG